MSNLFGTIGPLLKQAGWDVIPLQAASKRPLIADWQHGFEQERIEKYAANGYAGGNTGLLTARFPCADIDIKDETCAAAVERAVKMELGYGPTRFGARPKRLVAYRTNAPFIKKKVLLVGPAGQTGAIEFLGDGQQYVAYGRHPDGFDYTWVCDEGPTSMSPDELPEINEEQVLEFIRETLPLCLPDGWYIAKEVETSGSRGELKDPREKTNIIGAFCRVFTVEDVLDRWLSDAFKFEGSSDTRLTFLKSDSGLRGGAVVLPGRLHVFNQHNSDPCQSRATNLFDLVRCHVFGHLDAGLDAFARLNVTGLPSYEAMVAEISALPEVLAEISAGGGATPNANDPVVLNEKDVMSVARHVLKQRYASEEGRLVQRNGGRWYHYIGTHYVEIEDDAVRSETWRLLEKSLKAGRTAPVRFNPAKGQIDAVIDAARAQCYSAGKTPPMWLNGYAGPAASDIVALSNGLFHIPTRDLMPHSLGFFTLNKLPYAWQPAAACPQWLAFLSQVWGDDYEQIETLQEVMGYLLTGDTSMQKIFMLVGPKRSGKGTIGRVLQALIGHENCCYPTVNSLATQFGLQPMIGKLMALISDARAGGQHHQVIVERMLMISGEDSVTVDCKNKEAWNGKLAARVVLLSNELLSLGDASGALVGRLILLQMRKSFFGREDTELTNKLLMELPGIFTWAIEGRERLMKRGFFIQPETSREAIEETADFNSPVAEFAERCCVIDADSTERQDLVFEAWSLWARRAEVHVGRKANFSKQLYAAFPGIRLVRPRNGEDRVREYGGIRLKDKAREIAEKNLSFDDGVF